MKASIIVTLLLAVAAFASPAVAQSTNSAGTQSQSTAPIVHHIPIMVHQGRIYVNGSLSGKKVLLLVDTGATVSAFPYADVPKHDAVKNMDIRTAAGTSTCARVEVQVDLETLNEAAPVTTQVGALFCSVSKFGNADGLLGADVLLNGRYASISFDFEHSEMVLVEKASALVAVTR